MGRQYEAFAVAMRAQHPVCLYLVCLQDDDSYPISVLSGFFEIVDARVPRTWRVTTEPGNLGNWAILPIEWTIDPCFLEKLVNEEPSAVEDFELVKKRRMSTSLRVGSEPAVEFEAALAALSLP